MEDTSSFLVHLLIGTLSSEVFQEPSALEEARHRVFSVTQEIFKFNMAHLFSGMEDPCENSLGHACEISR